jgi:hypothetical protein
VADTRSPLLHRTIYPRSAVEAAVTKAVRSGGEVVLQEQPEGWTLVISAEDVATARQVTLLAMETALVTAILGAGQPGE